MNKFDSISILERCINETKAMTKEEFLEIELSRGILNKEYNIDKYISDYVEPILPYVEDLDTVDDTNIFEYDTNFTSDYNTEHMQLIQYKEHEENDTVINPLAA